MSALALSRHLAHQPVRKVDFLPEGRDSDAFVAAMRARVIQIVEHAIDAITRHTDEPRVFAVARTRAHLRKDYDRWPQLVSHFFDGWQDLARNRGFRTW